LKKLIAIITVLTVAAILWMRGSSPVEITIEENDTKEVKSQARANDTEVKSEGTKTEEETKAKPQEAEAEPPSVTPQPDSNPSLQVQVETDSTEHTASERHNAHLENDLAKALKSTGNKLSKMGFDRKAMVSDFETGILCTQRNKRNSFYFDLKNNLTILFKYGNSNYVYHFPHQIVTEPTEDGRTKYSSASRRSDLALYYTFEVLVSKTRKGTGKLFISENYPPSDSDLQLNFICNKEPQAN